MTNLQRALAGDEANAPELRLIRDRLPELSALPLGLIEEMYRRFSREVYDASWMGFAGDNLAEFREWLGEEARR